MNNFHYVVLLFAAWMILLDALQTERYEEPATPKPTKEKDPNIYNHPYLKAAGLKEPKYKTDCLTKDIETIDLSDQLNGSLSWQVKHSTSFGKKEYETIEINQTKNIEQ